MKPGMKPDQILQYCLEELDGTVLVNSWGERGVFYNPENRLKRGVYVLTVKEKDGDNDRGSALNREGFFRVNVGVKKETFQRMFGHIPERPAAGKIVAMDYDFTIADTILPHPVYAWMGWCCVLTPSEKTFEQFKPLIWESYEFAKEKYRKRKLPRR